MRPRRPSAAVAVAAGAVAAAVLVLGLVPTAAGVSRELADPRGDAPAAYDITGVRYTHGARRVAAVAEVPGLGDRGEAQLSVTDLTVFEAGYVGQLVRRPGAPLQVRLLHFDHVDLVPQRCRGVRGSWAGDRVRLSVPKRCLTRGEVGQADRLFVQLGLGQRGRFDLAPAVRRLAED